MLGTHLTPHPKYSMPYFLIALAPYLLDMDMQVLVLLLLLCAGALGQDRVWTSMIGSSSTDEGKAVAIDPTTGSVYVAGYAQAALSGVLPWTTGNTLVVVKYARNGTQLYARQLQAVDYGSLSYVNGIAVSPNGQDVYVTGGTSDGSTLYVFVSQIRSDDGGASMARVFGPAGQNAGNSVAIDSNGYVYIVGQVCGSTQGASYIGGDSDILLIKYNSDGDVLWTRLLGTTGADEGYGVAIDTSDNIYISGAVSGGLDGEAYEGGARDMVLFKYTPEGARDWTRIAGTSGLDIGYAVVVDSAREAVYMTGTCEGPMHGQAYGGSTDICLLKYALDGTKIWTMQTGTSSGNNGYGIGLDASSGAVFVTGSAQGSLLDQGYVGDMDVFLMKVHANGTALWARMEGTMGADAGNAVAVDSSRGTVYVAGFASGSLHAEVYEGGYDIFLTSYLTDPAVPLPSSQPSSLPTSQPSAQYTNVCQSRTFRDIATQTNFTRHRCFTVPSIAPLPARSDFLCNPFSVSDTLYASSLSGADFSCQFTACPGDRVRMSMLPSDGGYCGGKYLFYLLR
ncbi:hypothetical protein EON63_01060 [archaeon]|nr:MAG: hypothetical protein EON63_01060 [archaeon]